MTEPGKAAASGKGNFFAVDRRTFARVCTIGMNPAVAYLVLARFSGRDNETTAASVNAIEKHTGISRGRAREALQTLCDHGYMQVLQSGTKPRYQLVPYAEVPGAAPPPMTTDQRQVYDRIKAGDWQLPQALCKHRNALVKARWVQRLPGCGYGALEDADVLYTPQSCWLPNAVVDGVAHETPPFELLRQTQDVMTLRMFVDLYYEQLLIEHGGVARDVFRKEWTREQVGARGEHVVWGFRSDGSTSGSWNELTLPHRRSELTEAQRKAKEHDATDLWARLGRLETLGLFEWVPYLFESAAAEAEVIHPYSYAGEAIERALANACSAAADALLREDQQAAALEKGLWLAPIKRHLVNVQMISIVRLRYRPRTAATSVWWAKLNQSCAGHRVAYEALKARATGTDPLMKTGT